MTATNKQIAANVRPTAMAKDAGEACAANSLAVLVPCHRVVRSDGSLGGYRWGAT
ncbi:methylated-DNA--[protein]-cysteine S-methyltransferase [Singulisphaera acidiphila]|uniref:methylated-DNA--[protein]-cysteine S-methyltransferase n=1 Tax=Singulisphaera acidiphila TaxID=466153 RepID=UPI0021BC198D|nr:methylated-DNA--[protein]-cysteine S-methyltransferase [Singulisphaera acidiphila]